MQVERLTQNFLLEEFRCKDGTNVPEEYLSNVKKLAENLQTLRDIIQIPIYINSGYRTKNYNKKVGGAKASFHLKAMASDLRTEISPFDLYNKIERLIEQGKMDQGGLILYDTFVHYDIRGKKYRSDKRTKI